VTGPKLTTPVPLNENPGAPTAAAHPNRGLKPGRPRPNGIPILRPPHPNPMTRQQTTCRRLPICRRLAIPTTTPVGQVMPTMTWAPVHRPRRGPRYRRPCRPARLP